MYNHLYSALSKKYSKALYDMNHKKITENNKTNMKHKNIQYPNKTHQNGISVLLVKKLYLKYENSVLKNYQDTNLKQNLNNIKENKNG